MGENPLGFWVLGLREESLNTEGQVKYKQWQWKNKEDLELDSIVGIKECEGLYKVSLLCLKFCKLT